MFTKKVTYTDFIGNERTEELNFHMNKAECMEFLAEHEIVKDDFKTMIMTVKELILRSYGEVSQDGRRFVKTRENQEAFYQTEAYSTLYMEFVNDENALSEFISKVIPFNIAQKTESSDLSLV